jgi:SAM-dependent methyltransferase
MRQDEYELMHAQEVHHWWFRGRRRVLVDLLSQYATDRQEHLRILDFGCGTGGNLRAYSSFGSVFGLEPDFGALRLAARRGGALLSRGSGIELPFQSDAFDVVVASDVLEHIENDRAAAQEISRVLRPDGAFIFSVPAHPWLFGPHDQALMHRRRYLQRELRGTIENAGLRVVRLSYWNSTMFPFFCAQRLVERWRPRRQVRSDPGAVPGVANELLTGMLMLEAALLRHGSLPWGLSLVGIALRR